MTQDLHLPSPPPEGIRARKQRQTRQRIAEAGLRLFLANGFDATTLDAIAEAADISRRTFFHYFESKEAILVALESEAEAAFKVALADMPADVAPLDAVRDALMVMISQYESDEAIAIDRLMRSTDALLARKQANYERQEQALFNALAEKWPSPARHPRLRMVALVGIGAMRLAAEQWNKEDGCQPLKSYLVEMFSQLQAEITL
ncbi:TetR family transcriptional regulator [Acidisoma cladoniae]|jgi:AcrR family transcriptional regulator|uniref:TetR family transcriptional regulator n=1 Tax=Acidisoma cladoniae TaxID=3040935 RepID=UPI00254FF686|nr:TetR family transcriptional regulator [Acidisoma sp. PAMC 29798]